MPEKPFAVKTIATNPVTDSYTIIEQYGLYFWLPYLGRAAYLTWVLIKSFAWGTKTSSYPSISRLARILSNSPDARKTINRRNGPPGTLAKLQIAQVLRITSTGEGPTLQHTFHILRALPLLSPTQLETLTPALQRDHTAFLQRHRIAYEEYLDSFEDNSQGGYQTPREWVATTQGVGNCDPEGGEPLPTNQTKEPTQQTKETAAAYKNMMQELARNYSRAAFDTNFRSCTFGAYTNSQLVIRVSDAHAYEWLSQRLHQVVLRAAGHHFHQITSLRFVCTQPQLFQRERLPS